MAINKPVKPNTFASGIAYSADVNENFDVAYAKVDELIDELNNAAGSTLSTANRLNVSLNADGTLKAGVTAGGEWLNSAFTLLYVNATTFTTAGNTTAIFTALRRIKATLAASTVYSQVVSADYSGVSGLTTIVLADAVLTNPITSIEHGTVSALAANGSVTPALIGAATAAQGTKADNALPAASYTAADVLAKLLTVDGPTSGIAAQTAASATTATSATAAGTADSATDSELLNGKKWVNIAESAIALSAGGSASINLRNGGTHKHYRFSAYALVFPVVLGRDGPSASVVAISIKQNKAGTPDTLNILAPTGTGDTVAYSVDVWE